MDNLSRRNLLKNAGIFSVASLFSNIAFSQKQHTAISFVGYNGLFENISKQTSDINSLTDQSLIKHYTKSLTNWEKNGYKATNTDYYICQDGNLALFPLHLHNSSMGLLDTVMLCFGKRDGNEWQAEKSLNGFDLEALTIVVKALQKSDPTINIADYLLPTFSEQKANSFIYKTVKGEVFLKSILSEESSKTKIIIREGEKEIFQHEILSQHSLYSKTGL